MTNEEILMDGNEGKHPETVAANLTSSCIYSMLDHARKDEAVEFAEWLNVNLWKGIRDGVWMQDSPSNNLRTTNQLYQLSKQSTITNKDETRKDI